MVTIHEFTHGYWMGLLASNEFEESWMDEGINTFTELVMVDRKYGYVLELPPGIGLRDEDVYRAFTSLTQDHDPILADSWKFATSSSYGRNSYHQSGTTIQQIRNLLGEETFWRAFRAYAERWRFDHPTSEDFFDAMRAPGDPNVAALIRKTWYGRGWIDFAILDARTVPDDGFTGYDDAGKPVSFDPDPKKKEKKKPDDKKHRGPWQSLVIVGRDGDIEMPAKVVLTFKDGQKVTRTWDGASDVDQVPRDIALAAREGRGGPRAPDRPRPQSVEQRALHEEVRGAVGRRQGPDVRPAPRGDPPLHPVGCPVSPLSAGVGAALRNRRLAAVLWLSLLASALVAWGPIKAFFAVLDEGAFRESLVKGWDSWGILSFLVVERSQIRLVLAAILGSFVAFVASPDLPDGRHAPRSRRRPAAPRASRRSSPSRPASSRRTSGRRRDSRCRRPSGSASSSSCRAPASTKLGRGRAAPRLARRRCSSGGGFSGGFSSSSTRGSGSTSPASPWPAATPGTPAARTASRSSVFRGRRLSGIRIILFWLAVFLGVQALFTSAGLQMNPRTNGAVAGLFLFRQIGFFLLAMARVGFFASLLAWEERRRPAHSVIGSASGGTTWNDRAPISARAPASAFPETGSSVTTNGSALLSS